MQQKCRRKKVQDHKHLGCSTAAATAGFMQLVLNNPKKMDAKLYKIHGHKDDGFWFITPWILKKENKFVPFSKEFTSSQQIQNSKIPFALYLRSYW
jgi:hypothetical protein